MLRKLMSISVVIVGLYIAMLVGLYFFQENFIFLPQKLERDYQFNFQQDFEELSFRASDGKSLSGLLFKADSTKGLIFYLHGNAGSLASWGHVANTYTALNYDVFILDYRGYGKSEGKINSESQLYEDNQFIYNEFKIKYGEERIVILGYSLGTGLASKLAADSAPQQLILQAPFYSLTDIVRQRLFFIPPFILKYKFATNENLKDCNMPITIFHGNRDNVVNYKSSLKLKKEFNDRINLITLNGQGHNGITDNEDYKKELQHVLQ